MMYVVKAVIKGGDAEYRFDSELMAETFAAGLRSIGFEAIIVEREVDYV